MSYDEQPPSALEPVDPVPTTKCVGALRSICDVEPSEYYEDVRSLGDVVWDDSVGAWLITSYDVIKEVAHNDPDWANELVWARSGGPDPHVSSLGLSREEYIFLATLGTNTHLRAFSGKEHARQHRWWMRAFSGRTVRHLGETLVRPIAHQQLDRFVEKGAADFTADFADRVAPRVIAAAMGFPSDDESWLDRVLQLDHDWITVMAHRYSDADESVSEEVRERARAAVRELHELARPYVEARRDGQGEDFISLLWRDAEEIFGPKYKMSDVVGAANIAFVGGAGTTAASTSNGLYALMTRQGLEEEIRDIGEEGVDRFVEETLRLYGPISIARPLAARRDMTLSGVRIRAGQFVIPVFHAGSRDPKQFPNPRDYGLMRNAPRRHLAFGGTGGRSCPGQGLGRAQLKTIFSVVLDRVRGIKLDPSSTGQPEFKGSFVRQWRPLFATFQMRDQSDG